MDPRLPHHGISASEADWSREVKPFWAWVPWKSLLGSIRSYQRHRGSKNPLRMAAKKVAVLRHLFWSVVTGADIPINCQIGGGLSMPHPNGIVIHPGSLATCRRIRRPWAFRRASSTRPKPAHDPHPIGCAPYPSFAGNATIPAQSDL